MINTILYKKLKRLVSDGAILARAASNVSYKTLAGVLLGLCILTGCSQPDAVDAVARKSKFKPVFGEAIDEESGEFESSPELSSSVDLSFLHVDHFGCVCLRPQKIMASKDLENVPWADVETQLASLVGEENSKLDSMETVWLLFDRAYVEKLTAGLGPSELPFVAILDYSSRVNENSLDQARLAASARKAEESETDTDSDDSNGEDPYDVRLLKENRIVIGDAESIAKIESGSNARQLRNLIAKNWDEESDAEASIVIAPIRSALMGIFELMSRFGGEGQKLAQLPDVVENIGLKLNLGVNDEQSDEMIVARIKIEDDQLAKELVKTIDSLRSASEPSPWQVA